MSDRVELRGLTVDCIVGVEEAEQRAVQPVVIDLALDTDLEEALAGDLEGSVDYASVQRAVAFLAQHGRWRLLETLGAAAARFLLAPPPPSVQHATVDRVAITLTKPAVLQGAVPAVHLERDAEWCDLATRMVPDKTWVDTLAETPLAGAYRAHVEPGTSWEVPPGLALLVIAGRLEADGRAYWPGDRLARSATTRVTARGDMPATVLAVGAPYRPGPP